LPRLEKALQGRKVQIEANILCIGGMKMDIEYVGPERRKSQRIESHFFVLYRLEAGETFRISKALGQNINVAGLMFEMENDVLAGDILYLEIYIPSDTYGFTIFSIPVQAKVVWVNRKENESEEPGGNKYQIGVEFIEIENEDRSKIIDYVEKVRRG